MKKFMLLIGMFCLIFTGCTNDESKANNKTTEVNPTIEGVVTEILEANVLLDTDEGTFVVYADELNKMTVGDRVTFEYDGQIMESDPPQIKAIKLISVSLPELKGEVKSVEDNQITLETKDGVYLVHLNNDVSYESNQKIEQGDFITVTFSGLVMESMPPQINALKITKHGVR
jgi:hypothetical protein